MVPLVFFRRVPFDGKQKGDAKFEGLGIVSRVELVSQYSAKVGGTFANYAFEFLVLDLTREHDALDWSWINQRRDPAMTVDQTNVYAPWAWRERVLRI